MADHQLPVGVFTLKNLFWFHAFNRPGGAKEILDVLVHGPKPSPDGVPSKTRQNEIALDLSRSAYAYLGQSNALFGASCVVFTQDQAPTDAILSPFDTGGLVGHIAPVKDWTPGERRDYAHAYSWSITSQSGLLSDYPGSRPAELKGYLNGGCPKHVGPHTLWGRPKAADIWTSVNQWPAWTWELRSSSGLPGGFRVKYWTTAATTFSEIVELAAHDDPSNLTLHEHLMSAYVEGGVSLLLARLRNTQERP